MRGWDAAAPACVQTNGGARCGGFAAATLRGGATQACPQGTRCAPGLRTGAESGFPHPMLRICGSAAKALPEPGVIESDTFEHYMTISSPYLQGGEKGFTLSIDE